VLTTLTATRALTILRDTATGTDAYGMDEVTTAEIAVTGCAWWPSATTEATQGRDTVSTRMQVILPGGTDIRSTDRLQLDGDAYFPGATWRVDGDPQQHWSALTGSTGGVTVWVEKVAG
jgi:hypothetical protein